MEEKLHRIPAVPQQPPTVAFIQTRLAETVDALKDAQIDYDPKADHFEPRKTSTAMLPAENIHLEHDTSEKDMPKKGASERDSSKHVLPVRELVPAAEAMLFWSAILDQAMARFIDQNMPEPEKLTQKPEYSIRSKKKWQDIHERLENASNVFNGAGKTVKSRLKTIYRTLADNIDGVKEVVVMVPDDGAYVSLVKFVLGMLFDVVSTAAQARIQITGFADEEEMKMGFGRVEIFLSAFPGDPNIKDASVDLIACILKAVEGAIVYFLSSTVGRALKSLASIGQGQNYKKDLIDSITEVPAKTKQLMDRVEESNIWVTQKALGVTLTNIEGLRLLSVENTKMIALKTDSIINQGKEIVLQVNSLGKVIQHQLQQFTQNQGARDAQQMANIQAVVANTIKSLFDDYQKKTEAVWEQKYEKKTEELQRQNKNLAQEVEILKQRDHSAATSRAPSPAPEQPSQSQPQWPNNNPHHAQPPFQPWQDPYAYPNPYPYPDLYHQNHYLAPLPTQHYPPPPPPPPPQAPAPPRPEDTIHVKALIEALNIVGLDKDDMEHAFSVSESIPFEYRLRAQEMVRAPEFQTWATATESRELLVDGDADLEAASAGSAVSLVAASLMAGLRARERGFASLVFFCGRHTSRDDANAGARPMIRSLITQLLEQAYVDYTFRPSDVGLDRVRAGTDLDALCRLFEWLAKWLSSETTLVVVVDGIGDYEMDRYNDDMLVVLRCLLGLARNESPHPIVKVLATSPAGTVGLRSEFGSSTSGLLLMEELQIVSEMMDMPELDGELR